MRYLFSLLTLVLLCLFTTGLTAQVNYAVAIDDYVSAHDARVSTRNWAKVRKATVTLQVNAANELEALVASEDNLRITLQREGPQELDELFPLTIKNAFVIITNETVVIVDQTEQLHFALTLDAEPALPEIPGEPMLVFTGYGIGRHWSKGL